MTTPPHTSRAAPPETPVFVDPSGRRLRRVRWLTWCVLGVIGLYLALVVTALLGGPSIDSAFLPPLKARDGHQAVRPGGAGPTQGRTAGSSRTGQDTSASPTQSVPHDGTALVVAGVTGTPVPTGSASAAPRPATTAPPTTVAAVPTTGTRPTTTPSASGTDRGKSSTAPGKTRRPTPPAP